MGTGGRALHLFVLASFAVAEPLYSVLKPGAAFFAVRRSEPGDLVVLALALGLGLPLVLFALQWLAGRLAPRLGDLVHAAFVASAFFLIFSGPLVRALDSRPGLVLPLAGLGAVLALLAYARWKPVRELLSLLAPAPLIFAGLFLAHPAIARFRAGATGELLALDAELEDPPTVVMVVLDELPITSLMRTPERIDPRLFPNFAKLAADSTWFRNATTSHESTEQALPAILTGVRPVDQGLLPIASDHPRNVFTMLGGTHRMRIWETFTSLCPPALAGEQAAQAEPFGARMASLARDLEVVYAHIVLPRTWTAGLPSVTSNWSGFGGGASVDGAEVEPIDGQAEHRDGGALAQKKDRARVGRAAKFKEFVDAVDGSPEPTFYFLHLLTPHGPWNRMPSGRRYDDTVLPSAWAGGRWPEEAAFAALAFQRHLLHLGHVDRMLGALLQKLEATGVYERALVLLVADHGINFTPTEYGRQVFPENVRKLAHVPLFIKRPRQARGGIDDRNVETIDLLPTLADEVGLDLPWEVDGTSVFSSEPARGEKTVYRRLEPIVLDGTLPESWPELDRKRSLFGRTPTWETTFGVGVDRTWIGRAVDELPLSSVAGEVRLDRPEVFGNVDPAAADVPCYLVGRLRAETPPGRVLIALGGVVRAAGFTFPPAADQGRDGWVPFAAMIPAGRLRKGANRVQVFGVGEGGEVFELTPSDG